MKRAPREAWTLLGPLRQRLPLRERRESNSAQGAPPRAEAPHPPVGRGPQAWRGARRIKAPSAIFIFDVFFPDTFAFHDDILGIVLARPLSKESVTPHVCISRRHPRDCVGASPLERERDPSLSSRNFALVPTFFACKVVTPAAPSPTTNNLQLRNISPI